MVRCLGEGDAERTMIGCQTNLKRAVTEFVSVILAIGFVSTCFAQPYDYYDFRDRVIYYWTCDGTHIGTKYTAQWDGDEGFFDMRFGEGDSRRDVVINYVTWDQTCWQAHFDHQRQLFTHKRFGDIPLDVPTLDGYIGTGVEVPNVRYFRCTFSRRAGRI